MKLLIIAEQSFTSAYAMTTALGGLILVICGFVLECAQANSKMRRAALAALCLIGIYLFLAGSWLVYFAE